MNKVEFTRGRLRPWFVAGELAGLTIDGELIPMPALGLETELGVAVSGGPFCLRGAVDELLARREHVPADARGNSIEADRMFSPLGSSYREGDHVEVNTWLHRSAAGARLNLEHLLEQVEQLAARCEVPILLHALGTDGFGASWSSLHCNVPISDRTYLGVLARQSLGPLVFDFYLPAELSLGVIDGNGGVGSDGYLLNDRTDAFDCVFGMGTMRPSRAMVVDRPEGFGTARNMGMLRALSFGDASVLGLALHQMTILILELAVHGVLRLPRLALADPLRAGVELARHGNRFAAARVQLEVQHIRRSVWDELDRELGAAIATQLLPDMPRHLDAADATLAAVLRDDEAELIVRCDWERKRHVLESARRASVWQDDRARLMELNVHYARLDRRALRHAFAASALAPAPALTPVPTDTSSWLLAAVVERALVDRAWHAALRAATLSWRGIKMQSPAALYRLGCWPQARSCVRAIELVPWAFTKRTVGAQVAAARDLDELLDALGSRTEVIGDYAGRRHERTTPARTQRRPDSGPGGSCDGTDDD
ncbi:MAG: proteasome accessory factor PafA2 family protein [Planctomycetota bacterium]